MQNLHSYDTSTQAMTEVALALSMAFFALLIVALLSFQVPQQKTVTSAESKHKIDNRQNVQLKKTSTDPQQEQAKAEHEKIVFFHQGKFVDQQLKALTLTKLKSSPALVLAVPPSLSFAEVMALRNKINHPKLSITLLNEQWQSLLEEKL
jgi:hypothetical protein